MRTSYRVATYRTLIDLLAVTGMRVGEAIALDRGDFDSINDLLIVRQGKFGKSRELPLHPTTVATLRRYLRRHDRPRLALSIPALFVSGAGARLLYSSIQSTFRQLVCRAGLKPRSA